MAGESLARSAKLLVNGSFGYMTSATVLHHLSPVSLLITCGNVGNYVRVTTGLYDAFKSSVEKPADIV